MRPIVSGEKDALAKFYLRKIPSVQCPRLCCSRTIAISAERWPDEVRCPLERK